MIFPRVMVRTDIIGNITFATFLIAFSKKSSINIGKFDDMIKYNAVQWYKSQFFE